MHLIIIIRKVTSFLPHYLAQTDFLAADCQGQGNTILTLTPSLIFNSKYIIMVSNWNCLTLSLLMSYIYDMELLVKPEILTSYIYIYMYLRLATLEAVSFYLPHNVSTLNQCRKFPVSQLCVNTLPATKITLITKEIQFGRLRVKYLCVFFYCNH
jgi:hypothetical protein